MTLPLFTVHGRQQALSLRRLCPQVELLVPRHVTITGGPAYIKALIADLEPPPWVDCASHRGHALGLIRMNVPRLLFDGPPDILAKLADIGAQRGCIVLEGLDAPIRKLDAMELTDKVLSIRLAEAGLSPC